MTRLRWPALAGLVLIARGSVPDTPDCGRSSGAFAAFVDEYCAALFAWDPNSATSAGIHDSDDKLADLSAAN